VELARVKALARRADRLVAARLPHAGERLLAAWNAVPLDALAAFVAGHGSDPDERDWSHLSDDELDRALLLPPEVGATFEEHAERIAPGLAAWTLAVTDLPHDRPWSDPAWRLVRLPSTPTVTPDDLAIARDELARQPDPDRATAFMAAHLAAVYVL
jgi:hypothetical protein